MKKHEIKTCELCQSQARPKEGMCKFDAKNVQTGKPISIKGVTYYCSNQKCKHSWLPYEEEKRINAQFAKESNHRLTPEQIVKLRKSIPIKTKFKLARLLGFNEKAFTKWERPGKYNKMNISNEILLRLVASSKENLEFVKKLHDTNFEFAESQIWVEVNDQQFFSEEDIMPITKIFQKK